MCVNGSLLLTCHPLLISEQSVPGMHRVIAMHWQSRHHTCVRNSLTNDARELSSVLSCAAAGCCSWSVKYHIQSHIIDDSYPWIIVCIMSSFKLGMMCQWNWFMLQKWILHQLSEWMNGWFHDISRSFKWIIMSLTCSGFCGDRVVWFLTCDNTLRDIMNDCPWSISVSAASC